jgi:response regulator RpfG family c-di-GMP phosphodiesterase
VDAGELNKRYVLVIDSDNEELFQTCMLLRSFGHAIITARSGEKALEFMIVSPPTAIIADPASGVAQFLSQIRQDPRFYDVPVVLLSWWPNVSLEEGKKNNEFFAYLRKPIDPVQLYYTVEAAVEKGPRRNIRITTHVTVTLEDGLDSSDNVATTLSEYGLFLRTLFPRQVGACIPAAIRIKDSLIRLEAVVLYIIPFDEGPFQEPGMGMKFVKISRPDRELIAAFIVEELKKGIRGF